MRDLYGRYFNGGGKFAIMIVLGGLAIVSCTILAGCASAPPQAQASVQALPQTPAEKLAAAELGYQAALRTILSFSQAGVIQGQDALTVIDGIYVTREALDLWHLHLDNAGYAEKALDALGFLQEFLQKYEVKEAT